MSIYKQNIDPIALTEVDADAFLESVGVELYKDSIAIDGTLYEGAYGEEVLAENGIFLYEDGIVLEGEQAEAYKARKKKEADDAKNAEALRYNKRLDNITKHGAARWDEREKALKRRNAEAHRRLDRADKMERKYYTHASKLNPDSTLSKKLRNEMERSRNNAYGNRTYADAFYAADAIERDNRKQAKKYAKPKSESTIFSDIELM